MRHGRGGKPVPIGAVIREILARHGGGGIQRGSVEQALSKVAGTELAKRLRVRALRGGHVTIETDSAALAYELGRFRAAQWLEALRREPGAEFVTALKFRPGASIHG